MYHLEAIPYAWLFHIQDLPNSSHLSCLGHGSKSHSGLYAGHTQVRAGAPHVGGASGDERVPPVRRPHRHVCGPRQVLVRN